MRIALVLERFNIKRGGAERSSYELACALARSGHEVTLLAGAVRVDQPENIPFGVMRLPVKSKSRAGWWKKYLRVLDEHMSKADYDIVHSMIPLAGADVFQPRGGSIRYSALRHAQSYNGKLKVSFKRAGGFLNRGRAVRMATERKVCADREGPVLAALSSYVKEQFETQYAMPPARLRVIRNGIDIEAIRNNRAKEQGVKLRQLYDRDGQLALFLFAAENLRLKGLTMLLEATRQAIEMRSEQRDFRILVVSRQRYAHYYRLAQKLKLGEHIVFMGATRHVPALLHMADAVVLPTYNDACSRIVLEGLAAGTPAITTRYNGAADFLGDKHGIVMDDCADTRGLALALLTICDRHQQKKMAMSIEADKLHEAVSVQRQARELEGLYREIS